MYKHGVVLAGRSVCDTLFEGVTNRLSLCKCANGLEHTQDIINTTHSLRYISVHAPKILLLTSTFLTHPVGYRTVWRDCTLHTGPYSTGPYAAYGSVRCIRDGMAVWCIWDCTVHMGLYNAYGTVRCIQDCIKVTNQLNPN